MTLEEAKKEILKNQSSPITYSNMDYESGWEEAISKVLKIIEQVDKEPAQKDKLTLTELANEFRRLLEFKYMTASGYDGDQDCFRIKIWSGREKPNYKRFKGWTNSSPISNYCEIDYYHFKPEIDFSEYRNEAGYIDYSKCIVEVE